MSKQKQKIIVTLLFSYSIYCGLIIGETWDEGFHIQQGKITLEYLFSFGKINNYIYYREYYSPIYWSLQYLLSQILPSTYIIETSHLINLTISLGTLFGIYKFSKEFFNRDVGKIVFLILFFYPVFFGHMAINSKDTIIAFSHVWITFFVFCYLKKQNNTNKTNNYIIYIGILCAVGTGIQLFFIGSLVPIIIFIFFDIFYAKKFICKTFNLKKFFYDLLKCFLIFYFFLIIFWIDAHANIFLNPFIIVTEILSSNYTTGYPYNLINGNYYVSTELPNTYILVNLFFKSPEYFILASGLTIFLIIFSKKFFLNKFPLFIYKIVLILSILIYANLILFLLPYPLYDGIRLFIWIIPYLCIIPSLSIYYFVKNYNLIKQKLSLLFLFVSLIFFIYNFISLTPYHYTYLNIFNGKSENKYKRFENDYWGSSIKELVNLSNFSTKKEITMATCGVSPNIAKKYFKKKGHQNIKFLPSEEAEYVIMTNRVTDNPNLITCFDKFSGDHVVEIKRNRLVLSVIKKIKN